MQYPTSIPPPPPVFWSNDSGISSATEGQWKAVARNESYSENIVLPSFTSLCGGQKQEGKADLETSINWFLNLNSRRLSNGNNSWSAYLTLRTLGKLAQRRQRMEGAGRPGPPACLPQPVLSTQVRPLSSPVFS